MFCFFLKIENFMEYFLPIKNMENQYSINDDSCFSFNEDGTFYVIGDNKGFRIYSSADNNTLPRKINNEMSVNLITINGCSNICCIVGTSDKIQGFSKKTICIWDMAKNIVCKSIQFNNEIRNMKIFRNVLLASTSNTLSVYEWPGLSLSSRFATLNDDRGLFACSSDPNYVCAFLSDKVGVITVYFSSKYVQSKIQAHNSEINKITISEDGKYMFTCSMKGTIIRMFSLENNKINLIKELRRGNFLCEIYSISISPNSSWLNVTSSTGTGHIFNLNENTKPSNKKSLLPGFSYLPNFINNYVNFEWSVFEYYGIQKCKTYSFIDNDANIIIYSIAGYISRYSAKMSTAYDVLILNSNMNLIS